MIEENGKIFPVVKHQRIVLCQSTLEKNSPVVILDEATSALDSLPDCKTG